MFQNDFMERSMSSIYDFDFDRNDGEKVSLSDYEGKVVLIVNTASKCGFTKQYDGLEALYQTYKDQGLEVIGFPCDQFGHQEPGGDEEIASFCVKNFGVTFPLSKKVDVNGESAHPIFKFVSTEAKGLLGSKKIKWNFTKFLVNKQGEVVERFAPQKEPETLKADIEALL